MITTIVNAIRRRIPKSVRRTLVRAAAWPPVGSVRFGSFRRLEPFSRDWGFDRGLPVDRYYMHRFLEARRADIRGRVLEIGADTYTRLYGGPKPLRIDVLSLSSDSPGVTIVGDLATGAGLPREPYDCVLLTGTLQMIFDLPAAVANIYRLLSPGGVALVTMPGISKISRSEEEGAPYRYEWCATSSSLRRLFEREFPVDEVEVVAFGNVLAATALLYGLASEELDRAELDVHDPEFEVLIGLRARRP